ncbi:hypothetical protein NMG60_11013787 [Bertholletia excelsa]
MTLTVSLLILPFTISIALASQGLNQSLPKPSLSAISTTLNYHGGPLLTGPGPINLYLIWYGSFLQPERTPVTDFLASFLFSQEASVATWWKTVRLYTDRNKNPVSGNVKVVRQLGDIGYSLGKNIKRDQIAKYVRNMIINKVLPLDLHGVYLFLTSKDVVVERFCMNSCGFHGSTMVAANKQVLYAHVGDPSVQCPGLCAWPYAIPTYGPPGQALVAPNGVGLDGMIINIATLLAGVATNPFGSGYFQGDAAAPLEAVTACPGIFGTGAYPGYPGDLKVDGKGKASYNAYGVNGRKFLLPAVWDPVGMTCKIVA